MTDIFKYSKSHDLCCFNADFFNKICEIAEIKTENKRSII